MGLLAEAIANGPQIKKGPPCATGAWLASLDDESRAEAQAMLDAGQATWPHTALNEEFAKAGLKVSTGSLTRHRKGKCANCG